MIVSSNQKLTVILSYNNTGTASCAWILHSITEKAADLLHADGGDCHNRGHGSLCNSSHRSFLICNCVCAYSIAAALAGLIGNRGGKRLCSAYRCGGIFLKILIRYRIHRLKNKACHQAKDYSQGNGVSCFFSKGRRFSLFMMLPMFGLLFFRLLFLFVYLVMCIFRFCTLFTGSASSTAARFISPIIMGGIVSAII